MHKLIAFAVVTATAAAFIAIPAAANPPAGNGRIAFTRFDPVQGDDFVYTANPDGSQEQQLLPNGAEGPRWSPDGSRVVVVPHDVDASARIVNPDDGSYRDLANPDPDLFFLPCSGPWSPDGQRLTCTAFGNTDQSVNGIYTMRSSDGGGLERVTADPGGEDCAGDYSPNGKRLVFLRASFDLGPLALYTVKLDGSDLRQLTPPGMNLDFSCGSWSPQGNEILFSAKAAEGQRSSIFVVHTDGSGLQQIPIAGCGTTSGCHEPVWSADGKKIALTMFVAQTGQSDLYTVNPDGTGLYQVTHAGLGAGLKDWGTHQLTP